MEEKNDIIVRPHRESDGLIKALFGAFSAGVTATLLMIRLLTKK